MTGPATDGDLDPRDGQITYEQHVEAALGASVYVVQHGDIHIVNAWPAYRFEPFPTSPKPISPDRAARQPVTLLAAESEVVGFVGRADELGELAQWRDASDLGVSVMLVHGPGGQGKTRLAARFAADSAAGGWTVWAAHHLSDPTGATAVVPGDSGQSLLVIVEYAERWPADHLQMLIQNPVLRHPSRTRVLLLTRPSGPWWRALRYRLAKAGIGVAGSIALPPLASAPAEREELFFSAATSFASVLGVSAAGVRLPEIQPADEDSYRLILTVHMAALVAVDALVRGKDPPSNPTGLSAYLLDREHDCWQSLHDHMAEMTTAPAVMSRTVFTATMTRPLSRPQARAALAQIGVLSGTPAPSREEAADHVLDDHAICYPPVEHSAELLMPLYPDRLGEDFIALATPNHALTEYQPDEWAADAAARLLGPAGQPGTVSTTGPADLAAWVRPAAATLIQTAGRWPHVARVLEVILRRQPELAQAAGGAALASLAEIDDLDLGVLEIVESRFPAHEVLELAPGMAAVTRRLTDRLLPVTEDPAERARLQGRLGYRLADAGLRDEALAATLEAAALRRQLAATGSGEAREDLAFVLSNLSAYLAEAGRRNEAAQVAQEAVDAYRSLAGGPSSDPPQLADALMNLSATLAGLGELGRALEVAEEATAAWRPLARADPFAMAPSLARALSNLSNLRGQAGQRAAAVAAGRESVQIWERLASGDSDRFDRQLAAAMGNLSTALAQVGEVTEAAAASARAVAVLRRLVKVNPGAVTPALTVALTNLASWHAHQGNWADGLAAAEEAISVLEPLAAQNAASFEPGLATALINESVLLSRLGRRHDALAASARARWLITRLVLVNPLRFAPDMASAWAVHAANLSAAGRREEALEDLESALRTWRKLAAANSAAYEPDLARALRNLGLLLSDLGRQKESLAAAQEANTMWTRLAADNPLRFEADLGLSLWSLSGRLADEGRPADALVPAEQAVGIFQRLAVPSARFQPELANSLSSLSSALSDLKRWPDALAASREAVAIWERLADGDPELFEPDLAHALECLLADLWHSGHGRHPDALPAAERLAAMRRRQATVDPARQSDLVTALHMLIAVLRKAGRRREAWAAAREVGHLGREHGRDDAPPVSSQPAGPPADVRVARTLTERGRELAQTGQRTEALATHEEATRMWRVLADRNSLCCPDLAQSLIQVGILLGQADRPEPAVAAVGEAAAIYRQLVPENPEEYEPQLARSLTLTAWSRLLAGEGRLPPCTDELAEAAEIYGRLAVAQPGTYAEPLSTVQGLLADLRKAPGSGLST